MRLIRVFIVLAACALCVVGLTWLSVPASHVHADTQHTGKILGLAEIHASQVFTDAYEPNDVSPGFSVGIYGPGTPCSSPGLAVVNASLYKFPGIDIDYYNLSVVGSAFYTISIVPVTSNSTTPINFNLVVLNQNNVQVAAATSNSPTVSFFAPVIGSFPSGGNYRIFIQAQNPGFDPGNELYNVMVCSSLTTVEATAAPSATPFGAGPDPFEPNDTPLQVLDRLGGIVSYINVGSQIVNANFYPYNTTTTPVTVTGALGDVDWYFFYAKKSLVLGGTGGCYRIYTAVQTGVDTDMTIYSDLPTVALAHNDDFAPLNRSSQLDFAVLESGRYWIRVFNLDSSPRGASQTYNIAVIEVLPTGGGCILLHLPRAFLPVQMARSAVYATATAAPTAVPVATATPIPNQLGSVILTGSVAITNVNAAAGNAFDEYADIFNVGDAAVTLVDWKIRVAGQVYNLSNPPGIQLQLLPHQGCRIYSGTNVGPVALPGEYNACGAKFLGITSGTKIYPNTTGYQIELLNESNVVVAYYGR